MKNKILATAIGSLAWGAPFATLAEHAHFVDAPGHLNENVGSGQTSIDDPAHGGHHRFHENVHIGTAGSGETPSGAQSSVGTTNSKNPVTIGKSSDL